MEVVQRVKAVIMAGGEGSRLRPLTVGRPKPMVPVGNRPVMAHILDLLANHGIQEVFVTLGYMPDFISNHFGEQYRSLRIQYVVEKSLLGTAGGVARLRSNLTEPFLVVSGDALTDLDLSLLAEFHRSSGAVATLALTRVENPLEYGLVLTDRRGRIRRFLEKPGWGEVFSDTVNTGIYVLDPSVLNGVPADRPYDFSQNLFPALLQMEAPLYATCLDGYWCDIGDPAAYLQANLDLLNGRLRLRPAGKEVVPGVWVEGEMPRGVLVEGPALIGPGCRLEPGARLEAGAVLGAGASVGTGAVLRRTVTWEGVSLGPEATLVGAVVCEKATLSAGAGVYEGAVIGADCSVGPKATVSPGVRLWPRTSVDAGARVECTLVQSPVWSGRLLRRGGLAGTLGADLFPENALRVGTALASVLPRPGALVIGADAGSAATLLKQALVCGALAAGRPVIDLGTTASPVTEFAVLRRKAAGGIHVRAGGSQARAIFYDAEGRPLRRDLQRKLEQVCVRQDFPRAVQEAAGVVERFPDAEWLYLEELSEQVDLDLIRSRPLDVEVEGARWGVLIRWLARLRDPVAHGAPRRSLRVAMDPLEASWRLPTLSHDAMLALEILLHAPMSGEQQVAIPVTASRVVEEMLERSGRRPVRVRLTDWRSGDPLLGIGRMLELMARDGLSEDDLAAWLPAPSVVMRTVECPWEAKGRVMRRLLEEHAEQGVELVDGVRIPLDGGAWTLILPDPDEPVCHIYSEARGIRDAERLADRYAAQVRELAGRP